MLVSPLVFSGSLTDLKPQGNKKLYGAAREHERADCHVTLSHVLEECPTSPSSKQVTGG